MIFNKVPGYVAGRFRMSAGVYSCAMWMNTEAVHGRCGAVGENMRKEAASFPLEATGRSGNQRVIKEVEGDAGGENEFFY